MRRLILFRSLLRFWAIAMIVAGSAHLTACFSSKPVATTGPKPLPSALASASPTPELALSARAVKIIFRQADPQGSFDPAPTDGTTAPVGHPAARIFNADGSLLARAKADRTWPAWFDSVEIGITGTKNTGHTNTDCARFVSASDSGYCCSAHAGACTAASPPATTVNCTGPISYFRISEADCPGTGTGTDGSGSSSDAIYVRARFNRDLAALGPEENILVVLEYAASTVNSGPSTPSTCFNSSTGAIDLTNPSCTDMAWQSYMKHSMNETVMPYLMLVPPGTQSAFAPGGGVTVMPAGSGIATKQFYLPFASDPGLSVLQLSRISRPFVNGPDSNPLANYCSGKSPLCMGVVFYSITFFRI